MFDTGFIPAELGNLVNLTVLRLGCNNLTGMSTAFDIILRGLLVSDSGDESHAPSLSAFAPRKAKPSPTKWDKRCILEHSFFQRGASAADSGGGNHPNKTNP